jgi:hypothetical protein
MSREPSSLVFHTRSQIRAFIKEHEERYGWYDNTIQSLLEAFPNNRSYSAVLNKVVVIDRLYSTSICDVEGMTRKILDLRFDSRARKADLSLVHDIASPNPDYSKNTNYNYSFATKYCNWHAKETYPIFDSIVKRVVSKYNRLHDFSEVKVKDYWDHTSWKQIIDELTETLKIQDYRYKKADKYLWALGIQHEI